MITGFNTDVEYNKKIYHVQTEDKGLENPYIESLIYVGGAIIFSKRTSYAEKLATGISEKEIRALMENQHKTIIAAIKRGRFENYLSKVSKVAKEETVETPSKETLDVAIKEFIKKQKEADMIEISIPEDIEFFAGEKYSFDVKIFTSISKKSIQGAKINIKLISTFGLPLDLFTGKTNENGICNVSFSIPFFKHGNAGIIILAESEGYGKTEYKQLVKKKA